MPTDQEVELALKLCTELKNKGLKGYVNSADDKERSLARRLIRTALQAYIAPRVTAEDPMSLVDQQRNEIAGHRR